MNDLQKKELEILKSFIYACEQLNLTYFLVCGSALGAIKYQGFIPWDDDIDVAMPRTDYEEFCKKAQEYLPDNLFIQTYKTDPKFPQIYCKLRDSNSTFIEKSAEKLDIHHGIFIDIFPLDGYPQNRIKKNILELKKRIFKSMLLSSYEIKRTGKSKILYKIYVFFGISKKSHIIAEKCEKMICRYKWDNSLIIANHGNWQGKLDYSPKTYYGKETWNVFEGIKVRVPEKCEEYLTRKYGNWRASPPKEEQQGHHYYKICEVNIPYTQYVDKVQ